MAGEVDSEAIIGLYDKYEKNFKEVVPKLKGGFAVAILDEAYPSKLLLYRHSNPLYFGYCKDWKCVFLLPML